MTRRFFMQAVGAGVASAAAPAAPRVAITMDDVAWRAIPERWRDKATPSIFDALRSHGKVRAALFVTGKNVDDPVGRKIVEAWSDEGHLIGNHTYAHVFYSGISYEQFSADAARGHEIVKDYAAFQPFFRFPGLKEGNTLEKRDKMRSFLHERNYRNGHVTIDASDWYYDARLRERLVKDPGFDVSRYRQPYLDHMWERSTTYDEFSRKVAGRSVPHTVLIHYNLLNTLFLGDLLGLYKQKGWQVIDAEEAYRDPIFKSEPKTLPAGESLIWALAKESGKFDPVLRYPGEDDVYEKPKLDKLGL